jgi:hypothetical protein
MKFLKLLPLVLLFIATSCVSVKVTSDYDQKTDFKDYKTFAFYKKGIDKVEISDLDKRRILKAIETQLEAKGFTKSKNPDILVNIFTKSREKVNVYNNNNWGYGGFGGFGWGGFGWGGFGPWGIGAGFENQNISRSTEGTLFIDLIDTEKKELAWQGKGTGHLITTGNVVKKEARINEFVTEIMTAYPPIAK